jgi:hypothetical protein
LGQNGRITTSLKELCQPLLSSSTHHSPPTPHCPTNFTTTTQHHSIHHRDQGIKTIKVAARPWELPTSAIRSPDYHHIITIRPTPSDPTRHPPTTTTVQQGLQPLTKQQQGRWELPASCPESLTTDPTLPRSNCDPSPTPLCRHSLCSRPTSWPQDLSTPPRPLASQRTHRASRTQPDRRTPAASAPDQQSCRLRRSTALQQPIQVSITFSMLTAYPPRMAPKKYKKIKKPKASSG